MLQAFMAVLNQSVILLLARTPCVDVCADVSEERPYTLLPLRIDHTGCDTLYSYEN
jgi:hypothetical protein